MSKPDPARYRTTNWKSYNEALKRRGSLLIWGNVPLDVEKRDGRRCVVHG